MASLQVVVDSADGCDDNACRTFGESRAEWELCEYAPQLVGYHAELGDILRHRPGIGFSTITMQRDDKVYFYDTEKAASLVQMGMPDPISNEPFSECDRERIRIRLVQRTRYGDKEFDETRFIPTIFRNWRNLWDNSYRAQFKHKLNDADVERWEDDARNFLGLADVKSQTCELFRNYPHSGTDQRMEREEAMRFLSNTELPEGTIILRNSSVNDTALLKFGAMTVKRSSVGPNGTIEVINMLILYSLGEGYFILGNAANRKNATDEWETVVLSKGQGPYPCFLDAYEALVQYVCTNFQLSAHPTNHYRVETHAEHYQKYMKTRQQAAAF